MNTDLEIDFGHQKDGQSWKILNDGVMGGLSKGAITVNENTISFKGKVSLANNGGFASFRSPFQAFDLSNYNTVSVRMKSVGQTFALTLETSDIWYQPYFKKEITLSSNDWEVVQLDLRAFKEYRIGRYTGRQLNQDKMAEIIRLGLVTNDKKAGPFELELDYIKFE